MVDQPSDDYTNLEGLIVSLLGEQLYLVMGKKGRLLRPVAIFTDKELADGMVDDWNDKRPEGSWPMVVREVKKKE